MTTMIADETPPHTDAITPEQGIEAANDNGPGAASTIDPRILVIARAIGRLIAREQTMKHTAANDNGPDDTQDGTE